MFADKPDGTTAYGQWNHVNDAPVYTHECILNADGHYAVKRIWTDDNLELTIPVRDFAAGQAVNIRFAMSGVATAPKYWTVEYFDQGTWKATSTKEFIYSKNQLHLTATYELTKANAVTNVNETARFAEAVADGVIRFRIRCASGACQTDGKAVLTKPGDKATIRIRQWSTKDHDAIAFYLVD